MLKGLVSAGAVPGERVWLENDALTRLESALSPLVGDSEVRLAFYVGVPSPHRKVTAQVLTPAGETLAYAKMATSAPAPQAALEAERRALLRLSKSERLRGKVPEVLGWFGWRGGTVLLTTKGPARPGPGRLSRAHLEFCEDLFLPFANEGTFGESAMWARMSGRWLRLRGHLPDPMLARFGSALEKLHGELGPVVMPLSQAHGDFAPWNTRLAARSLFVFDWERAGEGVIPLYDAFNFQALPAALRGGRRGVPDRLFLRTLLGTLWPEGERFLPLLHLAYLLDVGLLYGEAQEVLAPGVGEGRVWLWFVRQIEASVQGRGPL